MKRVVIAVIAAAVTIAVAAPAQAMTPRAAGWSPLDPPSPADLSLLKLALPEVLYTVTCGGLTATGWAADAFDDTVGDWDTMLITTSSVAAACVTSPPIVRQGDDTFMARGWLSAEPAGLVALSGNLPYIDWDDVPTPRLGQWVALGARSTNAEPLELIQRSIESVGDDTFTLDFAVDASYVGAPVLDNRGRALGVISQPGTEVTGAPQFCDTLFGCDDPTRVWWDITAPSKVTKAKAVGAKRSVVVTWGPVADDGGAEVGYLYRIGTGEWMRADGFRVTVKAKKDARVSVTLMPVNHAGPGPTTTRTAVAK